MPNKNDLTSIKLKNEPKLQNTFQKKAGRKPKPAHKKCSECVVLKFTPSEMSIIKEKAGLVPLATFLKNTLSSSNNK